MGKKITVSFLIILICSIAFINGYTYVYPSYADSTTNQWESVTTNQELVTAFRYYCKSRNLAIEGSVADALTTFTTNRFNQICNTLGIDVTALQAHLKRSTDGNGRLQFLFDQTGVTAYNRIFAELLQNNDIDVGDQVNKTAYDGKSYTDANGNYCLVWIMPSVSQSYSGNAHPIYRGSTYCYNGYDIKRLYDNGITSFDLVGGRLNGNDFTIHKQIYKFGNHLGLKDNYCGVQSESTDGWPGDLFYTVNESDNKVYTNQVIAYYVQGSNTLYIGTYIDFRGINNNDITGNERWFRYDYYTQPSGIVNNVTVNYTTNNNTVNNNNYEDNKQTVINNEGDVYNYNYDNDDPPVNPDSGGGGGGTVTPPSDSGGSDGDITFPNFDFQLPEIDWSIGDVTEKFPFSIPFDLIAFFTVLNAEPRAPAIDANIPLGSWYTWHFQADFSQFNNWATIIRNVEFIAFCIGLIYLTIRLIKG